MKPGKLESIWNVFSSYQEKKILFSPATLKYFISSFSGTGGQIFHKVLRRKYKRPTEKDTENDVADLGLQ